MQLPVLVLKVESFIEQLEREIALAGLSVQLERVNEFYSTQEAKQRWPGLDDNVAAAALLLQDYLDQHDH